MFWKKKGSRLVDSLFKMYRIAHCAISDAHLNGIYSVKEYTEKHDSYINRMLDIASDTGGARCAYKLSCICADYHEERVKYLEKKREKMEANEGKNREKENDSDMEEKYDGYVTTVTKSPVYSNRWQPTLSEQPWRSAIGEAGWHAREGEMGSRGQEKTGAEFVIGGGRGVESGPLRGADEKPAVTYIYHLKITHQKEILEIARERDKLFDILKNMGFEVSKVDWKTICIHTTNNSSGFVKTVNSACERSGVGADYEAVYKGKLVPVVRYEEEV